MAYTLQSQTILATEDGRHVCGSKGRDQFELVGHFCYLKSVFCFVFIAKLLQGGIANVHIFVYASGANCRIGVVGAFVIGGVSVSLL